MRVPKTNSLVNIPFDASATGERRYSLGLGTPEQPATRALDAFNQAGNFYAPIIKGLEDASQATTKIMHDMLEREAKQDAMRALTSFTDNEINGFVYGSNGVLAQTGQSVIGSTKSTAELYNSAAEKYTKNLSPRSVEHFNEMFASQRYGTLAAVARHEGEQRLAYGLEVNKKFAMSYKNTALNNFGDDRLYEENAARHLQAVQQTLQAANVPPEHWDEYLTNAKTNIEFERGQKFMATGNFERAFSIASNPDLPEEARANFQKDLKQKYFSTLLIDAEKNPYELEAKLREAGFDLSGPSKSESNQPEPAQGQSGSQKSETHFEKDIKSNDREQDLGLADLFSSEDRQALFQALERGKLALGIKIMENQGSALYASLRNNFASLPLEEQETQIIKELTGKKGGTELGKTDGDPNKTKAQPEDLEAPPQNLPNEEEVRNYALELAKKDFALQKSQQRGNDYLETQKMAVNLQKEAQNNNFQNPSALLSQIESNQNLSSRGKARLKLELLGGGPKENANNQTALGELYAKIDMGEMNNAAEIASFMEDKNFSFAQGQRALDYWQACATNPAAHLSTPQTFKQSCQRLGLDLTAKASANLYRELMEKLPASAGSLNEEEMLAKISETFWQQTADTYLNQQIV